MRYVAVGLAFGAAWAGIQYAQGRVTDPAGLAGAVLLCGAFGTVLWLVRTVVVRLRRRS